MASKVPVAFLALLMTTMTFVSVNACETGCSNPSPPPPPAVPTPSGTTCPDLSVCVDLLGSLLNIGLNVSPSSSQQCCPLLEPLASADAALCVCGVIKVLNLSIPVDVSVLLNYCNKTCPPGFTCPL